jgi:hypothetical protein
VLFNHVTVPVHPVAFIVTEPVPQIVVLPEAAKTGADGKDADVTTTELLSNETQPDALAQVAVYVPAVVAVKLSPIVLFDHVTVPVQPIAFIVTEPVPQIVVLPEAAKSGADGKAELIILRVSESTDSQPNMLVHFAL